MGGGFIPPKRWDFFSVMWPQPEKYGYNRTRYTGARMPRLDRDLVLPPPREFTDNWPLGPFTAPSPEIPDELVDWARWLGSMAEQISARIHLSTLTFGTVGGRVGIIDPSTVSNVLKGRSWTMQFDTLARIALSVGLGPEPPVLNRRPLDAEPRRDGTELIAQLQHIIETLEERLQLGNAPQDAEDE